MRQRRERKFAQRANSFEDNIFAVVFAERNIGVGNVWQFRQRLLQLRVEFADERIERVNLHIDDAHLVFHRFALRFFFRTSDFFRRAVALCAQCFEFR